MTNSKTITKIELNFIKYRVKGVVKIKDWYGNIGYLEMTPVDFNKEYNTLPTSIEIGEKLNDNGYGCQTILGGYVTIYEVYEKNVEVDVGNSLFINNFTEDDLSNVL